MSVETRTDAGREVIRFAVGQSSLGPVLVAESARGVCALMFNDAADPAPAELQRHFPGAVLREDEALGARIVEVVAVVEAPGRGLAAPLDLRGTEFQRMVWQALREIPVGTTATYTEIAARIERPRAVRAVAQACAANALAVVIPCHRVVRSDGQLSGYRWGVDRKRALLEREAA
jgi:AraC family transcriptional regulator of adaptative response/methylated-DNA-[protein]-cysteine methyltransferase